MKFNYQAKTIDNQLQSGSVNASSHDEAILVLQKHGLRIVSLEKEKFSIYNQKIDLFQRITGRDIVLFSRQLSVMAKSGIPIVENLRSIAKQTNKSNFSEQIYKISSKVESGESLSQALEAYPKLFTPFYIGMVKSGETSGRLSDTLEYLANHLEKENDFNAKILSSMAYPAFIAVIFIAILMLLMIFVMPGLQTVFEGMDLPLMTRIVLGVGNFLVQWWWIPILFIVILIFSFFRFIRTDFGRIAMDKIYLRLPLIGDFIKKLNMIRIAENISTLIAGGIPVVQTLDVVSGLIGSDTYKSIIIETRNAVRRGEQMSSVLVKHPKYFSMMFIQMITVGEKTGKVDSSLLNVVRFYQGDIDRSLNTMVKLMEPVMILIIGGMIGIMVISLLSPIYQMTTEM